MFYLNLTLRKQSYNTSWWECIFDNHLESKLKDIFAKQLACTFKNITKDKNSHRLMTGGELLSIKGEKRQSN